LREAYDGKGELVDIDPMLELKERFVAIMEEGHKNYLEDLKRKSEALQKEWEIAGHEGVKLAAEMEEQLEEGWHSGSSEGDDDTDDAYDA